MYFLTYHSQPSQDAGDIDDVGGAYINCYILADSLDQADKIARDAIERMRWNILDREDSYEIDSESVSADGPEHFEQALIDNAVYVLHTYPISEGEDE